VNSTGTLTPGYYDYAISAISSIGSGGESAPAKWATVQVLSPNDTVQLTWAAIPGVTDYKVWGRVTGSSLGLIATVPVVEGQLEYTYTDTGSVTPTGTVPVEATIDNYYASLGVLTVNMFYSTRPKKLDF
jgi:hypothetical protein